MWVFTNKGFLSIVQHKDMPGHFQVRARTRRPLEELWPGQPVQVIGWADYRYRISIRKEEVLPVLIGEISGIEYTSFKNSCKDEGYLRALVRVWSEMHRYQTASEEMSHGVS